MNKIMNLPIRENKDYIDITTTFHPSGKTISELKIKKNLYRYQVCKNICSFKIDKTIKKWTGSFAKYKGIVLVFASNSSDNILDDIKYIKESIFEILDKYKNEIIYKPGKNYFGEIILEHNFFGKYLTENDVNFDNNSFTIEINGIPNDIIISLCKDIIIKPILVKNLNNNEIYIFKK